MRPDFYECLTCGAFVELDVLDHGFARCKDDGNGAVDADDRDVNLCPLRECWYLDDDRMSYGNEPPDSQ